jgi:hypothetical protein
MKAWLVAGAAIGVALLIGIAIGGALALIAG